MDSINTVIGGEAGQGLATIGQLLAKILVRCGYSLVVTQDYQSRIRGGHNTYRLRTSSRELKAPQEGIDLLVALDSLTAEIHRNELTGRGIILIDRELKGPEGPCLRIPFRELAPERYANITALGVVASLLGLPEAPQPKRWRIFSVIKTRGPGSQSSGPEGSLFLDSKSGPFLPPPAAGRRIRSPDGPGRQ